MVIFFGCLLLLVGAAAWTWPGLRLTAGAIGFLVVLAAGALRLGQSPLPDDLAPFQQLRSILRAQASPMPPAQAGDWRSSNQEAEQTLEDFARHRGYFNPRVIYVQPLSTFEQSPRLLSLVSQALGLQFGVAVRQLPLLRLELPERARRPGASYGTQLLTGAIHGQLLGGRPGDALAVIALTESDLWPGPGWNYVFGQANLLSRVGVWSTCRLASPDPSLFHRRALRTALHETGHLLGLHHCGVHPCLMNGSNSLPESDSQPLALCGECAAKVWWAGQMEPVRQLEGLIRLARPYRWEADVRLWEVQLEQCKLASTSDQLRTRIER